MARLIYRKQVIVTRTRAKPRQVEEIVFLHMKSGQDSQVRDIKDATIHYAVPQMQDATKRQFEGWQLVDLNAHDE